MIKGSAAQAVWSERRLILFLAFTAMASGPGTDLKMLATGLAAGILLDATVIRRADRAR